MHKIFSNHWLFGGLSDAVKEAIYRSGEIRDVGPWEMVIREDVPNIHMYVLLEGRYKVSLPDRPNRISNVTLGYRGPGDLLGEYSLIDELPASASVTAEEQGLVFRIEHDSLRRILASSPEISSVMHGNLLRYLVAQLRAQDKELDFLVL